MAPAVCDEISARRSESRFPRVQPSNQRPQYQRDQRNFGPDLDPDLDPEILDPDFLRKGH